MTKISKINKVIIYSGLSCPDPNIILNRIRMNENSDSDELVDMIIKKYRQYILSYRIQNHNVEDNYIKTELRLVNLDTFILGRRYEKNFPIPQTKMTKAMFGDDDFIKLYNSYLTINTELKIKRENALIKLKKENEKRSKEQSK